MRHRLTTSIVSAGLAIAIFTSASAHHSVTVNYYTYAEGPIEIMATVTEVEIRNPHSLVTFEVTQDDGTVMEYLGEWSDGNALRRRGVEIDRVQVGEEVLVHARRHRRLNDVIYIRDIIMSDGTMVRDCGAGIYRGDEYFATCEEADSANVPFTESVITSR